MHEFREHKGKIYRKVLQFYDTLRGTVWVVVEREGHESYRAVFTVARWNAMQIAMAPTTPDPRLADECR